MIELRDYNIDYLYNHQRKNIKKVELINPKDLDESKKLSIVSDSFFKTMFLNQERIKYSSKLLSYFVNISYEELCDKLELVKESLDKNTNQDKEQRVDYLGKFGDTFLNIEINNCSNYITMKRNILYAFRLMNKNNKRGKSDREITKLQSIQLNIIIPTFY